MRPIITNFFLCALIAAGLALTGCSKDTKQDKVIMVDDDDDAEMTAAIAKARQTLPHFWEAFDRKSPEESMFALKAEIKDSNGSEHFWLTDIERTDGKVYGKLNNDPNIVRHVKLGERLEIPEADISDWLYMRGEKMVGNFTMRVLFKQMPPEEVKRFKAILIDP